MRIAQIPLRDELRQCLALAPIAREALPAPAETEEARRAQIQERAVWMQRDLDQAAISRQMCNRNGELVSLIEANNAGPEDE